MPDYLDQVIDQARAWDAERPRSQQTDLGWSDMASCRSYMGFRTRGEWASDEEDTWRAIAGTALHAWLTEVRVRACNDADIRADFDVAVNYRLIPGHIDEVTWQPLTVTDYKFPSKSSARLFDDPDVLEEKFIQPHGYAAGLLERMSSPPADADVTVRLLVCPVNGTFDDWRVYERPFDREAADNAANRYDFVRVAAANGDPLPKDKPWWWCESFCEFYRTCRTDDEAEAMAEITDPELAAAVEAYGLAREQHSAAERAMKDLAPLISGLRGTARGWKVRMSKAGAGKLVPDEDAMILQYQEQGWRLPMRPKSGTPARLLVSREKT